MIIRIETPTDVATIRSLVTSAFSDTPHSNGTEAAIVDALRDNHALTISLVAEANRNVVGYIALSPVTVDLMDVGWYGLGPVAVAANMRRQGIAKALIESGLQNIKTKCARGCVVLGDPAYYARFGFKCDANLRLNEVPPEYFQCLTFDGPSPKGIVEYHTAFAQA